MTSICLVLVSSEVLLCLCVLCCGLLSPPQKATVELTFENLYQKSGVTGF
jgi:hypothetical protein